jgi:outer membrane protein TolC
LRADALVREARAGSFPTLSGNAVGTRLDHARTLSSTGAVLQPAESLSANATLAVPLLAPLRWVQWSHAGDNAQIARLSAADVRRTLSIAVARAYLAVVAQQRVLEVSERAYQTAVAHYDFARRRRLGGVGNRLDEVRAGQERETTLAQAQLARSALAKAQEALGVLLAENAAVDAAPEVTLPEPPPLGAALHEAPSRRSDVKVLESRLVASEHMLRDSYADYLPLLVIQGQPFYQNPPSLTQPETGWQAQLILTVPLYDGGFRYGAHDERAALVAESQLALDGALRQVRSDVRAAFEEVAQADRALAASTQAARLAREALELATQAYQAGATTNLEVIDAERQARDADTAAAVAEDGARQARLDLLAASGRFP